MLRDSIRRFELAAGEKLLDLGWWEFASRVRTTSLQASQTNRIEH
jgi:hypothetical protein